MPACLALPAGGGCACLVLPLHVAGTIGEVVRRLSGWAGITCARRRWPTSAVPSSACSSAAQIRFGSDVTEHLPGPEPGAAGALAGRPVAGRGYDVRFIGTGSDEFRKVLNAGVSLTAAVAIFSYAINLELSRGYVVIALPSITLLDLVARYAMRKRLHRQRAPGSCMHSVVAVGHELAVADLVTELRRDRYHGLTVVGACVARPAECDEVAGVPVYGGPGRHHGRGQGLRRGYRRGARLPGNGRHQAPQPGLGAGEDRHRPVRLARAARRGGSADDDQADGRAHPAARGSPAAGWLPPGRSRACSTGARPPRR